MTKKNQRKINSGFIALFSAIFISVILLLMISNLNLTGFYGRMNVLDYELKERSMALAEGCADTAILKLIQDSAYAGSETIEIGEDNCIIKSITSAASEKTINVTADYKNYVTNMRIVLNSTDMSVVSWQEI